jgi:hypothetical protein
MFRRLFIVVLAFARIDGIQLMLDQRARFDRIHADKLLLVIPKCLQHVSDL